MTNILTQAVSLRVANNPTISPGLAIADNVENVLAVLSHWTGNATARIALEMSFDGGVTPWREVGFDGPITAPDGSFKNRDGLWIQMTPTWRKCGFVFPVNSRYRPGEVCGELYYTGWPAMNQVHSDYAFAPSSVIARTPLSAIIFHDPNLNQLVGPLRQVRASIVVSGNVSSQLTVDAT